MKEMHLTKKDFRVDWFSGTGAGGQYRNKHQNCCRITHVATGLVATGQSNRDRPSNQREAFRSLAGKFIGCDTVADLVVPLKNLRDDFPLTLYFEQRKKVMEARAQNVILHVHAHDCRCGCDSQDIQTTASVG